MIRRFECTQCGRCCLGRGRVRVTLQELDRIREILPLPIDTLVVSTEEGLSLRTMRDGGEDRCVLLGADNRCRAYDARPSQCRTFPFWPEFIESDAAWNELATHCEGIGRGPVVPPS